jgi:hypothetical protein
VLRVFRVLQVFRALQASPSGPVLRAQRVQLALKVLLDWQLIQVLRVPQVFRVFRV